MQTTPPTRLDGRLSAYKNVGLGPAVPDLLGSISPRIEGRLFWDGSAAALLGVIDVLIHRARKPPRLFAGSAYPSAALWLNRLTDTLDFIVPRDARHTVQEDAMRSAQQGFRALAFGRRLSTEEKADLRAHVKSLQKIVKRGGSWSGESAGAPAESWADWLDARIAEAPARR